MRTDGFARPSIKKLRPDDVGQHGARGFISGRLQCCDAISGWLEFACQSWGACHWPLKVVFERLTQIKSPALPGDPPPGRLGPPIVPAEANEWRKSCNRL